MSQYFDILDYVVFVGLLLCSSGIGIYFAFFADKKQNTTLEYLMGGKTMKVFPISMSLIASDISGVAILGIPAEIYVFGTMYSLVIIPNSLVTLTMAYVIIPVFYQLEITSSYEYLRLRFDKKVQTLGSILFIIKMMLYIPIVIYVPALAFNQVTGMSLHAVATMVCIICIFYTTLGGLKAVVWTDTLQIFVMIIGVITVIVIGLSEIGLRNVWKRNMATKRIEFNVFDLDPTIRHTFWSLVIGNYFYWLAACSVNQAMVQRCLSLPNLRMAKKAILNLAIGVISLVCLNSFIGLVISAYFYKCDPLLTKKITKFDQILPYFVIQVGNKLPGLPGIFLSGVFSAALSTMSTGLNSLTGVIFEDLIRPNFKNPVSEAKASFIMKLLVTALGTFCLGMIFVVEKLGVVVQATKTLGGISAGPLLGLFSLGMFFPWANSIGALTGGICSLAIIATLSIFSQTAIASGSIVHPKKPFSVEGCLENVTLTKLPDVSSDAIWILEISYMWYALLGFTTVIVVGLLVSYITGINKFKESDRKLYTPIIHGFLRENEKQIILEEQKSDKDA